MHIDSHYAATLTNVKNYPKLEGKIDVQTCVIGAGFAGLTSARELRIKGHNIALVEAERVGWGASGRNGGFVSAGFARSASSIAAKIGWQDTRTLYKLSQTGRDYVRNSMADLELEESLYGHGWLRLLRNANVDSLMKTRDEMAEKLGVEWNFVNKKDLAKFVNSDAYFAGLHDEAPFHIQPLQYACALAQDIVSRGGQVFEQSRCVSLSKINQAKNGRWLVKTKEGEIIAENIVLATSAYGGPWPALNRTMIPVATYVVSSKPCGQILETVLPFKGCIGDTRRSGDYYRGIGEGNERRLIWGGRITTMRSQPNKLAQLLKRDISSVYPQLADIEIERAWSGLMGYAVHQMPIIGELQDGLWAATAFGGHGLNTTAMAGQLIAAAISEGDDAYKLFEQFGPRWSGGVVGRIATQLEYWRLQFLDKRDEKHV